MDKDILVNDQGSIVMLTPISPEAREWISQYVAFESWQWFGGSLCVEHGYADDLIEGMQAEGLTVAQE